jgi:ABC-type cobalamin transport system permease subunit
VAIENVLLAAVSVFAVVLTLIAVLAYRRTRDAHLVLLAAAFGVFFVKGLVLTILLFSGTIDLRQLFLLSGSLDLVVLALFYGFTLRR